MEKTIEIGNLKILVTFKKIKNVHLSVYPPDGQVRMAAPENTRLEVARAYVLSRLSWIKSHQESLRQQHRESPRQFVERESHYLWGRRHLLSVIEAQEKPSIRFDHRKIKLTVRPGSPLEKRQEIMHEWHLSLLHALVPTLIKKWEGQLGVKTNGYYLQRMKTKWGSCNTKRGHIRLNSELVKKPKDLLEYVVVHELIHLIEPLHSERFVSILEDHYPSWREARMELNALPLSAEEWHE